MHAFSLDGMSWSGYLLFQMLEGKGLCVCVCVYVCVCVIEASWNVLILPVCRLWAGDWSWPGREFGEDDLRRKHLLNFLSPPLLLLLPLPLPSLPSSLMLLVQAMKTRKSVGNELMASTTKVVLKDKENWNSNAGHHDWLEVVDQAGRSFCH